jgi:hypothetical protein
MKKKYTFLFCIIALSLISSAFKTILNSGGKAGKTGSPGETTCNSCHGTAGTGSIAIDLPTELQGGASYTLGQTYTISVTLSQNTYSLFGFGFEALKANGANGGNLTPGSGTQALNISVLGNSRKNIVHTFGAGASANSHTFTFTWTAPSTNDGDITFYTAGIAADGSGSPNSNDKTYSTSLVIPAPQSVGVDEQVSNESGIFISTNPNSESVYFNYSLNKNSKVKAELFNLEGKAIELFNESQSSGNVKKEIEIEFLNLANGIYFISLEVDGNKTSTKKIIINR